MIPTYSFHFQVLVLSHHNMHPSRRVLRPRPSAKEVKDKISSQSQPDLIPSLPAIQQTSCPLFTILPPEIRNRIYTFSLESDNTSSPNTTTKTDQDQGNEHSSHNNTHPLPYRQNAFYYRPGYKQPKRIQTALLQTCQQIYQEASLLPSAINEHTFWFYRAPPHVKDASSPLGYFLKMSAQQRDQVRHLHLFVQQFFLEDNYWGRIWEGMQIGNGPVTAGRAGGRNRNSTRRSTRSRSGVCRIAPKRLTITFRHTDWWFWENNEPLGIDPFRPGRTRASEMGRTHDVDEDELERAWGNQFIHLPSLEELVIEFETVMRKRDQLDAIIQRALSWKFPIQPEESLYLVAEPKSRSAYTWVGAKEGDLKNQPRMHSNFGPQHASAMESGLTPEQGPVPVPVLKPFDPQAGMGGDTGDTTSGRQSEVEINTEEFYVVFLTWRRQLVEE